MLVVASSVLSSLVFAQMSANISRLEGSIQTMAATISVQLQAITQEIKDGQQRMDGFDRRIRSLEAVFPAHARKLEEIETRIKAVEVK